MTRGGLLVHIARAVQSRPGAVPGWRRAGRAGRAGRSPLRPPAVTSSCECEPTGPHQSAGFWQPPQIAPPRNPSPAFWADEGIGTDWGPCRTIL